MTVTPPQPRPPIVPTNSLILLLPQPLFAQDLLALFEAHFGSYGEMVSWTALEKLGRVFAVYDDTDGATAAKREMDGFVWEDEAEQEEKKEQEDHRILDEGVRIEVEQVEQELRIPLRVFFGPQLALPLQPLESTLLAVPALSRNFLISPPGSPPVGWEQTLEEAPNRETHADDVGEGEALAWGDELARALRFLSVSGGGDDDEGEALPVPSRRRVNLGLDSDDEEEEEPTTSVVLAPQAGGGATRPAVTVSTPAAAARSAPGSDGMTPPPGGAKITAVKATIESLLGRKRSFSGLDRPKFESPGVQTPTLGGSLLGGLQGGTRITPTARPPVAPERDFVQQ